MYRERLRDVTVVGYPVHLGQFLEAQDVGDSVSVIVDGPAAPIRIQPNHIRFLGDGHPTVISAQM